MAGPRSAPSMDRPASAQPPGKFPDKHVSRETIYPDRNLLNGTLELLLLAIPVVCIAWTVTHEELFREPRDWCERQSRERRSGAVTRNTRAVKCALTGGSA